MLPGSLAGSSIIYSAYMMCCLSLFPVQFLSVPLQIKFLSLSPIFLVQHFPLYCWFIPTVGDSAIFHEKKNHSFFLFVFFVFSPFTSSHYVVRITNPSMAGTFLHTDTVTPLHYNFCQYRFAIHPNQRLERDTLSKLLNLLTKCTAQNAFSSAVLLIISIVLKSLLLFSIIKILQCFQDFLYGYYQKGGL